MGEDEGAPFFYLPQDALKDHLTLQSRWRRLEQALRDVRDVDGPAPAHEGAQRIMAELGITAPQGRPAAKRLPGHVRRAVKLWLSGPTLDKQLAAAAGLTIQGLRKHKHSKAWNEAAGSLIAAQWRLERKKKR